VTITVAPAADRTRGAPLRTKPETGFAALRGKTDARPTVMRRHDSPRLGAQANA